MLHHSPVHQEQGQVPETHQHLSCPSLHRLSKEQLPCLLFDPLENSTQKGSAGPTMTFSYGMVQWGLASDIRHVQRTLVL
jgi:hypothetical protein